MTRPKNFKTYKALVDTLPGIECKGATTGYTSINGNMFTFLSKEGGLGIRLSKEDILEFKKKYNAEDFIQYGAKMKEYVSVPENMIKEINELKPWFKRSLDYAQTLKTKK